MKDLIKRKYKNVKIVKLRDRTRCRGCRNYIEEEEYCYRMYDFVKYHLKHKEYLIKKGYLAENGLLEGKK